MDSLALFSEYSTSSIKEDRVSVTGGLGGGRGWLSLKEVLDDARFPDR